MSLKTDITNRGVRKSGHDVQACCSHADTGRSHKKLIRELKWLIGKNSPLSLKNKLLLYKTVLKPIWTYGIELWDCTAKSNIKIIQRYQSKLLGTMTNAPWYVSSHTLHTDLRIPYVRTVFQERNAKHRTVLTTHPIPTIKPLLQQMYDGRLTRRWSFDGLHKGSIAGCLPRPPPTSTTH